MTGERMEVAEVMSMKGTLVAMIMSVTPTCTMHPAPSIKERRSVIGRGFIQMTILTAEVIQVVQELGLKVKKGPLILLVLRTSPVQRGGGHGGDRLVAVTVGASILRREEKDGDIIQKREKYLSQACNVSSQKSEKQLIKIQLRRNWLKS